jgi:UDP-N-acetylmuramoylalanine--D-glutamate ligase
MKKLLVLGAGESGTGAAILGKKKGFDVFVSDKGNIKDRYKKVLSNNDIEWEEGKHSTERFLSFDLVVKSPGIPDHIELIQNFHKNNTPVISEIELAAKYTSAKLIGITGSNGKTTTAHLTYSIIKNAGLNVALVGNVGNSFAWSVAENNHDYYVIEISSFQLDGMFETKLDIAILLNITPDHLDRYDYDFNLYRASKFRISQNQTEQDVFIYSAQDEAIINAPQFKEIKAQKMPFDLNTGSIGAWIENKQIHIQTQTTKQTIMGIHELGLQGKHNLQNSMAAGIATRVLDIKKEVVRDSLMDFQNIEHRLEHVANIHGIEFINDSKATNVNSTWYALESMNKPLVWIVGGVDKGNDYTELMDLVKAKVHTVVCLGTDNRKLHETFDGVVENVVDASSAEEAVALGYRFAQKDQVVLLSPACASFDLFENYEERGNQFKAAVRAL